MRIRRILCVLSAFVLASVLHAQTQTEIYPSTQGQAPTKPTNIPTELQQAERLGKAPGKEMKPQGPVPMTEKEVLKEIKSSPAESLIKDVMERGVDFDMTPNVEKKLRKLEASDEVVEAVRQVGPKVQARMAKVVLGADPDAFKGVVHKWVER